MATIPPRRRAARGALVGELTVIDGARPPRHLPAHPAVGRREDVPDVVDPVQPEARAHQGEPARSRCRSPTRSRSAARSIGRTIQGDARIIEDDPHGGWERLLPIWEAKEPSIVYFLKARVALPLFFERALIEITPRRVLYWADGDARDAPIVTPRQPRRPRDAQPTPTLDARTGSRQARDLPVPDRDLGRRRRLPGQRRGRGPHPPDRR